MIRWTRSLRLVVLVVATGCGGSDSPEPQPTDAATQNPPNAVDAGGGSGPDSQVDDAASADAAFTDAGLQNEAGAQPPLLDGSTARDSSVLDTSVRTPQEIEALAQSGVRADEQRRELVVNAVCRVALACASTPTDVCRQNYDATWNTLRAEGASTECLDARLDFASCLATVAQCSDAASCESVDDIAIALCEGSDAGA